MNALLQSARNSCFERMNAPLFHAAWQFALGIALTHWISLRPALLLSGAAGLALLAVLCSVRAQRLGWLPLALLWCTLGAWAALVEPHTGPNPLLASLSDNLLREVDATVVDARPLRTTVDEPVRDEAAYNQAVQSAAAPAKAQQPTERIDVDVSSIEWVNGETDQMVPSSGRLRLMVRWPENSIAQSFHCGDVIHAYIRLQPTQDFRNPEAWNSSEFLNEQGITASTAVKAEQIIQRSPARAFSPTCLLRNWQLHSAERLMSLPQQMRGLPAWIAISPTDAIMLTAMLTGDRTYLSHSLRMGFERTGSFHLLVVAGFHLAIVAACVFSIARWLRLQPLYSTLLTLALCLVYALFTGFALPVARAFFMILVYLVGRLFDRERSALNALGFAALCLLALHPHHLFDASLQMTLLAVVSIAAIGAPIARYWPGPLLAASRALELQSMDYGLSPRALQFRQTLRTFSSLIAKTPAQRIGAYVFVASIRATLRLLQYLLITIVVELSLTLAMAIDFHRVTLAALPVNLLVLPLLFVLLPLAFCTLFLLLLWPAAASIPAAVTAVLLHISVALVQFFGGLQLGDMRIPTPSLLLQVGFYGLLGCSIALLMHSRNFKHEKIPCWGALFMLALAATVAVLPLPVQHPRNELLLEAIDVGQGDSLLLITPDGKTLLIDAGGPGGGNAASGEFDYGEQVVAPALWARGIRHLDAVALTHAHSDHMGGMASILRDFHPAQFWVGSNPPTDDYNSLLRTALLLGVPLRTLRSGDNFAFGTDLVQVLAPAADYKPKNTARNDDSLVLHIFNGQSSILFTGDAETAVEQELTEHLHRAGNDLSGNGLSGNGLPAKDQQATSLQATVLKVGHHGSQTSTHADFLAQVHPQWAIISCGAHNHFGHPHPTTLNTLAAAHVQTLRTDLSGALCLTLSQTAVTSAGVCPR